MQLTRNPDSLASALRTLAGTDVKIPGAVTVNFLFPVWDKDVDKDETHTDIGSALLHMHLDHDKRLAMVTKLGAQPESVSSTDNRPSALAELARDLPEFLRWATIGIIMLVLLVAASLAAASGAMMVAWWVLKLLFVTVPAWLGSLI